MITLKIFILMMIRAFIKYDKSIFKKKIKKLQIKRRRELKLRKENFNNVVLEISKDKEQELKERSTLLWTGLGTFLTPLVAVGLYLLFSSELVVVYIKCILDFALIIFLTSLIMMSMFLILSVLFRVHENILLGFCEHQSRKRIKFLPLSDKVLQQLNINSRQDYCDFLNHFFFRTITGKTYNNMSFKEAEEKYTYWAIAEMPYESLKEINDKFSDSEYPYCIKYDYDNRKYVVSRY